MSHTYAIGDIQGCYDPLMDLVDALPFDPAVDKLWFVGDLVNRGPHNLKTLEYVRDLGSKAVVVLGNHDLHLLAIVFGGKKPQRSDTFHDVLESPKCEDLSHWLRNQPLIHQSDDWVMVHAGLPHIWTVEQSFDYAYEVENTIRGENYVSYFEQMYGKYPDKWEASLNGMDRLRIITNYLTRMRFIAADGQLEFAHKEGLKTTPTGFKGWFEFPRPDKQNIVFGHWAALEGETNNPHAVATDTGCVWGRELTAFRLEDGVCYQWSQGTVTCLP